MSQLRVGIAGIGGIASRHIEALAQTERGLLVAVYDTDAARMQSATLPPAVKRCASIAEMFAAKLDAVLVCTPPDSHCALASAALKSGHHVFVEKPMARTLDEALELAALADANNRLLQVGHITRFDKELLYLRSIVDAGLIGTVFRIRVTSTASFIPDGSSWRDDPKIAGGGILFDLGTHALDALGIVLGDRPVRRITGRVGSAHRRNAAVEDHAVALIEFEGGVTATLDASYGLPPSIECTAATLEIQGDRGWARNRPLQVWLRNRSVPPPLSSVSEPSALPADQPALFRAQLEHFIDLCLHNVTPRAPATVGLTSLAAVLAVYRSSAAGGETIELAEGRH